MGQTWFESDGDYASRISDEANSTVVEKYSGDSPRQGWFKNDSDNRHRIAEEAHEATIERLTGSVPREGWFEADDVYRHRLRHEANSAVLENLGEAVRQGLCDAPRLEKPIRERELLAALAGLTGSS